VPRLVAVAVPVPLLDALTYRVPDHLPIPAVGARVQVPLGPRKLTGCVVAHPSEPPASGELKDITAVIDDEPLLPAGVVDLCQWVAEYYLAGIGDAIAAALPPGASQRPSAFKTRRVAVLTVQGLSARGVADSGLTQKQRAALDLVAAANGLDQRGLSERGASRDVVARLVALNLVTWRHDQVDRDPFPHAAVAPAVRDEERELTAEQAAAVEALSDRVSAGFHVALLHGVTGSGKTEIYLRIADLVLQSGRQVLLMVPEIALTPSVAAFFRDLFGDRVAIQHSGLSLGERHDQWHRIRRGEVDVVVGTRSAVFAPLPRLGLVVVDEEHDTSYKQDEAPRYHGRDVAIVRASRENALVLLGSATPSMESYHHAVSGKYQLVTLSRRVLDRPLASVRIVNMREEYAAEGPDVVLSRTLVESIEARLEKKEQVVVLLNRRGYATSVMCRQCGDTFDCPNCSISLTVHRAGRGWRAQCHYCNHTVLVPKACRKCAAPYLEHIGFGTERVEEHLAIRFPQARIGRVDRDAVRRKGALTSLLSRFAAGELDIVVGTQMIAKGHDFPRVTLVGVVSADVGLGMADFRAAERTFQLLTQVAGRAGRGEQPGEAIVQTLYPDHYSVQLACRQDYAGFFERELAYRKGLRYPPIVALVNAVVRGRSLEDATHVADLVADHVLKADAGRSFTVLGPAPAPLTKLRGEHRAQLFLKGSHRGHMRRALQDALEALPEVRRRVVVDVDPLSVL
jgi:primosomal protein N' (replication factor Y) (superfamily II helicase)